MPFLDTDQVLDPSLLSLEDPIAATPDVDDGAGSVGGSGSDIGAGDDSEGELSSGPESAYEEDDDLDRPPSGRAKKAGRTRKDRTTRLTAKEKGKGKEKGVGGQSRGKASALDEEDDVFE